MAKKNQSPVTLDKVRSSREIRTLVNAANDNLAAMGYTEHGLRHVGYVSRTTANILKEIGADERTVELGAIAGFLHDIGNAINRKNHGLTGATMAYDLLNRMKMDIHEIVQIISAIGNHEEETGRPVNAVSAALIIADKSDAHRTRVREGAFDITDIHDRVNMAIKKNYLVIDKINKVIRLVIIMDDSSAPMEYLQIYLSRMILCEQAAVFLQHTFELVINGVLINHHRKAKSSKIDVRPTETLVSDD